MLLIQFPLLYFWVRRPGLWESRTVCISVHDPLLFLPILWLVIPWLEFGWSDLYCYIYVSLVVGISRETAFGVPICIVYLFHPSAPRPYIRTGWFVVRQIDGPCQFFCRNWKPILDINLTFQKLKWGNPSFILYFNFKAWTDLSP